MSVDPSKIEYDNEEELLAELQEYMKDPNNVEEAAQYLLDSLIDESILGIVFEQHHACKTGCKMALDGEPEDIKQFTIADLPDIDLFAGQNIKKAVDCTCPNCDRLVAASRFAPHLEKCMGMGRNSSRIASRRIASNREGSNYYGAALSDDDDDADWASEKRKKRISIVKTNGNKKNGKSS